MHVIGAKAECFYEALQPSFKEYQSQVLKNIKVLAETLKENGFRIISNGTDNHLILVDVKSIGLTGKEAEEILDKINITCNKNTIPYDTESPMVTSGIRIGSPAMTTRGLKEEEFKTIGKIITSALKNPEESNLKKLKEEVLEITKKFPLEV
jgi:glycine hydroxymethyltransferase